MAHRPPSPTEGSRDPLRRMRVYHLADDLMPDAWTDAKKLAAEPLTQEIASQHPTHFPLLAIIPRERGRIMKKYEPPMPKQPRD